MNITVITHNEIAGVHCWPEAAEHCENHKYLVNPHHHTFVIECVFAVDHVDRQIEIFDMEGEINDHLHKRYNVTYPTLCDFGANSCESIAVDIFNAFLLNGIISCTVREDGKGGACVRR